MLIIGQRMNNFIISAVSTQWRAGRPDGAAILGVREDEDGTREYVTAMLPQHEIDRPEAAESWMWGHYFHSGTNENAATDALQDWAERAGIHKAEAPATTKPLPTACLLDDGRLLCGHDGCEQSADTLQEAGYTRDWDMSIRRQDGKEAEAGDEVDASGFVITAIDSGLEDFSDDGDGRYYLVCRVGHHSELPFETWNWD